MRGAESCDINSTCMRGGTPKTTGGHQPNMEMEASSATSVWQFQSVIPKQEPMDQEERNDSGINSGSDFHSSSPGSDHSVNIPYTSPSDSQIPLPSQQSAYFSTPVARSSLPSAGAYPQQYLQYDNSMPSCLKTEESPRASSAAIQDFELMNQPSTSSAGLLPHTVTSGALGENHLDRLQMTLEKTGLMTSPSSSKTSECSVEDENKSDNEGEDFDEQELRIPKVNSHGKVKTFKCKQCDFVAITKLDFWDHSRIHIKPDKLLTCPQCRFVTEYKHHLEYHLRNHFGSKPFKCNQCEYSCVNKSMLNSHLKSHSKVYQFHCADCSYATKYCHSLKLHLRKYKHKPAMVLNPDGTPNPLPIIDVYGTRRGPKLKAQEQRPTEEPRPEQPILPFPLNQLMMHHIQVPFPGFPFFPALQNQLLLQSIANGQGGFMPPQENPAEESSASSSQPDLEVLDLSKPEGGSRNRRKGRAFKLSPTHENTSDEEEVTTMFSNVEVVEETPESKTTEPMPVENMSNTNINGTSINHDSSINDDDISGNSNDGIGRDNIVDISANNNMSMSDNHDNGVDRNNIDDISGNNGNNNVTNNNNTGMNNNNNDDIFNNNDDISYNNNNFNVVNNNILSNTSSAANNEPGERFRCQYCVMSFGDAVLHTMHMGYHGYNNPFTCNMCGQECRDKVSFFVHIARTPHS